MKLVPYEVFGRLRLRQFCPNDNLYKESIHKHSQGHFIQETINGFNCICFTRWSKRPDELAMIVIGREGWASTIAGSVLSAIGLNLEAGLSLEETGSRFGPPPHWRKRSGRLPIFQSDGDSPYEVNCGFTDAMKLEDMKLFHVVVRRLDIELPVGK
jgi:hypothetical protein